MKPDENRFKWVTWLPALMPAALVLLYVSLAAHFRLASGHWPTTLSDDFSSTLFAFHERLTMWFALITFLVPAAWLTMLLFRRLRRSIKTHLLQALAYGLGWALIVLILQYDPTFFSDWLFD